MKEKAVLLAVSIPFILALILSFIDDGSSGGSSNGQRLLIMVGWGVFILMTQLVILRYRVVTFKMNRGDYDADIQARKYDAELNKKLLAELPAKITKSVVNAAKRPSTLASGAIGLLSDVGVAAAEKLEQRASAEKDSSRELNGSIHDDITTRLEKLSNLHELGHISKVEFEQQRTRILGEV